MTGSQATKKTAIATITNHQPPLSPKQRGKIMSENEKTRVQTWVAGLRALADYVEANPELCPLSGMHNATHCTTEGEWIRKSEQLGDYRHTVSNGGYTHRDLYFVGGHAVGIQKNDAHCKPLPV